MKKIAKKSYFFILIVGILIFSYVKYYISPTPIINSYFIDNNGYLNVLFSVKNNKNSNIYCYFSTIDKEPSIHDENWFLSTNNSCLIQLNNKSYYTYLKNDYNIIYPVEGTEDVGKIVNLKISKEKVYVAKKGTYSVSVTYSTIGKIDPNVIWYSDDENIATVDSNGLITGKKVGETLIHARVGDMDVSTTVRVTTLITVRPKKYNSKKPYLTCDKHNKKENDLLDAILKDRIEDAGYKTRAGVVEAARFLALEFPYKIRYFSENGRGSTNKVDGEGRYYHIGLYLDESRYKKIGKSANGPKTWGCSMYSVPSHGYRSNGFDCSGFVSWVLLNGGFDVGDIGAGLAPHLDLTDYGKRTKFNSSVVKSGKVKVGDLLSSGGPGGGHIAVIVGEDKNYYYVAESLWTPPNVAVVIIGYSKKTIFNRYYYVMLMDSYYKEDGNLTKLWY